jgi:hypothetical protein
MEVRQAFESHPDQLFFGWAIHFRNPEGRFVHNLMILISYFVVRLFDCSSTFLNTRTIEQPCLTAGREV